MLCYTVNWGYWAFVGKLANSDPSFFVPSDDALNRFEFLVLGIHSTILIPESRKVSV